VIPPPIGDRLLGGRAVRLRTISLLLFVSGCGGPASDSGGPAPNDRVTTVLATQPELGRLTTTPAQQRKQADDQTYAPAGDGWESEAFVELAQQQLKRGTKLMSAGGTIPAEALEFLVTHDFTCTPLRPSEWSRETDLGHVQIRRGEIAPPASQDAAPAKQHGPSRFAAALTQLAASCAPADQLDTHVKFHGVTMSADEVTTTIDIEINGRTPQRAIQQNATWIGVWTRPPQGDPQLKSLGVSAFEEVVSETPEGRWFADCTAAVLGDDPSFNGQIMYGQNHWLRRIERIHHMQIYERNGLAVGDVNGDGRDDVYLCQCAGLPNRLYVQQPDGTARDVAHAAGVDWLDDTHAALMVDLDNDGDADLALSGVAGVVLMENDGRGKFRLRRVVDIERAAESLSAVDYDNDGDLDLYCCVYRADPGSEADSQSATEFLYHDANDGGPNHLLRNDLSQAGGEWTFSDVTVASGLDVANRRWSLAASWEDYDNDGDQDLYVANDYGQKCLYRNEQGRFTEVAKELGVVDYGSGMSVSWGDYDRDGWMDLYVGNMFSSAGNRIATQPQFMTHSDPAIRNLYQRFAKGNSLFRNQAGKRFEEVGDELSVEMARWAWSSLFVDVNNDGWQDLLVANGFITAADSRDL